MKSRLFLVLSLSTSLGALSGCKDNKESASAPSLPVENSGEHIDSDERALAARLKPAKDPIQEEIEVFQNQVRKAFLERRFDDLEKQAAELRTTKETFGSGSWKLAQFYDAFDYLGAADADAMWQAQDRIHQDWVAAKVKSSTARIAYANFLIQDAWRARGSGYADSVTEQGWRIFEQRINAALRAAEEARQLPEKDPYAWLVALIVARAQGWPKSQYDALAEEARTVEPKFWGYHSERAYSLLPRWHGEKGDWEAYAEKEAARPDGLGNETYARIVIGLRGYYTNIFRETNASWPKTREGLQILLKKYPQSLELVSHTASLAALKEDRDLAKAMFDRLGETYLPGVWRKPERFAHVRNWALTGNW